MNIVSILFLLIIRPLELFFEVVFSFANRIVQNPGLSIIFLSLSMNFLVLPLYRRADQMQEEERDISAKLAPVIAHIKKTFKGDQRFMMLQTYYRQNNYKPSYALRGSLSLLLQIPFFIAAYRFLSGLQLLRGIGFGPITDLGAPDQLIRISSVSINLLPVLMTTINIISGAIYTKGHPLKTKIQLYGMAVVFLFLLYDSPAGLVFYWTLNNLFSMLKNVFYKLKHPRFVLSVIAATAGVFVLIFTIYKGVLNSAARVAFIGVLSAGLILPLILHFILKGREKKERKLSRKPSKYMFIVGAALLTAFIGIAIPSFVVKSSPAEFVNIYDVHSPLIYIACSGLITAGFMLVWCGIFYWLTGDRSKIIFENVIWILSGVAILDFMLFGKKLGTISTMLQYDVAPEFRLSEKLINLAAVAAVAIVFYLIIRFKPSFVRMVMMTGLLAILGLGIMNAASINKAFKELVIPESVTQEAKLPLSKDKQNVIVFMLDRGMGPYVPYIFNEKPELKAKFDGFTYYPDTVSFGPFTNFGVPAVFGGYEYTPEEMNKRDTEPLGDKQNECIKVMPYLFRSEGYDVTVCDPSYAGYQLVSDISIFDEEEGIDAYITIGKYNDRGNAESTDNLRRRNFFFYGVMKAAPLLVQGTIYNNGIYNQADPEAVFADDSIVQAVYSKSEASGISKLFMDNYSVLCNLDNMTEVSRDDKGSFILMVNETTHEPALLEEPQYVPATYIDNTLYDSQHEDRFTVDGRTMIVDTEEQMVLYHANVAAFIQLGEWFDYLREIGVYDNTRIILVSDHGRELGQFEDIDFSDEGLVDVEFFSPLLMVKDFNSTGFTVSDEFMTNADTPVLATEGIIDSPVNPFTGKAINSDPKSGELHILYSKDFDIRTNNGTKFNPGKWYSVKKSIFSKDNWSYLGDY